MPTKLRYKCIHALTSGGCCFSSVTVDTNFSLRTDATSDLVVWSDISFSRGCRFQSDAIVLVAGFVQLLRRAQEWHRSMAFLTWQISNPADLNALRHSVASTLSSQDMALTSDSSLYHRSLSDQPKMYICCQFPICYMDTQLKQGMKQFQPHSYHFHLWRNKVVVHFGKTWGDRKP